MKNFHLTVEFYSIQDSDCLIPEFGTKSNILIIPKFCLNHNLLRGYFFSFCSEFNSSQTLLKTKFWTMWSLNKIQKLHIVTISPRLANALKINLAHSDILQRAEFWSEPNSSNAWSKFDFEQTSEYFSNYLGLVISLLGAVGAKLVEVRGLVASLSNSGALDCSFCIGCVCKILS